MGAMKKLNSMRTIRNIGWVAGLLYGFLDLYIVFTVDLNIVFTDLFAPLSRVYVPLAPSHAATVWVGMSAVLAALVGRVEMVGGIWMLLVTWGTVLAGRLPRALNALGVVVGVAVSSPLSRRSRGWGLVFGWVRWCGLSGWGS